MVATWRYGWIVATLAALAAGCGGKSAASTPLPSDETSQQRLVPWQLRSEGTSALTVGIFDVQRRQHCGFAPDRDGTLRCLPQPATSVVFSSEYADSDCAEPLYYASALPDPASLLGHVVAVPHPEQDCDARQIVGTLQELSQSQHFYRSGDACVARVVTAASDVHYFTLAEEDPDAWASAALVDGPLLGGRLRLRRFESSPGDTQFDAGLEDERAQIPCRLFDSQNDLVCVGETLLDNTQTFTDPECSGEPLYPVRQCAVPAYIGSYGAANTLRAVGPTWDGPVYYYGKVCELRERGQDESYVRAGELLGDDALATAAWTAVGSARLQLRGLRADDGSLQPIDDHLFGDATKPRFHDQQADSDCRAIWTIDGGVRCVPDSALIDPYTFAFADEACTVPAYLCVAPEGCPYRDLVLMGNDDNGQRLALSRNSAVRVNRVFFKDSDGCRPDESSDPPVSLKAGDQLPWSDYAELEEVNGRASGAP